MAPRHVHLVGSIGLDSTQEVFAAVGGLLGDHLIRVPDGEPGGRRMWINWQFPLLRSLSFLQPDRAAQPSATGCLPLRLTAGTPHHEIRFGELGYAREARASYQDFLAARSAGVLPSRTRFQVCLPTPFAVIGSLVQERDAEAVEPAYEDAMIREVRALCSAIPEKDLCIQWDICPELVLFDAGSLAGAPIAERTARLAAAIPSGVEMGYHLCYGDLDGKHYREPADAGKMCDMMGLIATNAGRKIAYFHVPVPIERSDDAYYAPLAGLKLAPETEVFLGLVHVADGIEGTRKRIETARKYIENFGVAAECGLSRGRTADFVAESLKIHTLAAEA